MLTKSMISLMYRGLGLSVCPQSIFPLCVYAFSGFILYFMAMSNYQLQIVCPIYACGTVCAIDSNVSDGSFNFFFVVTVLHK